METMQDSPVTAIIAGGIRTFVKTKNSEDATDVMFRLGLSPGFQDVKADFFIVEDDSTISFTSPTAQDGVDAFWIFAAAGHLDIRAGIRQRKGR